ncbi:hypothetical protein Scep_011994 [Stephania cephalantha]|uniref:Uncharacterized protein n=1 Tax=Stephania cephalantha TaxID=152367 RepID=A0AAP0JFS7_9MAGN
MAPGALARGRGSILKSNHSIRTLNDFGASSGIKNSNGILRSNHHIGSSSGMVTSSCIEN